VRYKYDMQRMEAAKQALQERIAKGEKYGKLSTDTGLTKGFLWKFANTDYIPHRPDLREKVFRLAPPDRHPNYRRREELLRRWVRRHAKAK
jgi:hypothetical protein